MDCVPNVEPRELYAWLQEQCDLVRAKPRSLHITGSDWTDITWIEVEPSEEDPVQSGANINTLRQFECLGDKETIRKACCNEKSKIGQQAYAGV